jgi:hypothetical protein
MSPVRVPLQASSLWAVAELKDVLIRTVAWLPLGMASANAPDAVIINSMAGIIDLRTMDLRNLISFPPDAIPRAVVSGLGTAGSPAMILMPCAFCYTLFA